MLSYLYVNTVCAFANQHYFRHFVMYKSATPEAATCDRCSEGDASFTIHSIPDNWISKLVYGSTFQAAKFSQT